MISSYIFSLAKPVGFLFCFLISGSGKPHSSKAVTAWSSHGAQESSFCHQVPSTRAGCGRKEPMVPWHSGCEPHGSPLEKGHETLWVSSFQFQQGLDNPKGRTWARTSFHAMPQLAQQIPVAGAAQTPPQSWAGAPGTSASRWWICAVPKPHRENEEAAHRLQKPGLTSGNVQTTGKETKEPYFSLGHQWMTIDPTAREWGMWLRRSGYLCLLFLSIF